jgi:hypothetical protein
MIDRTVYRGGTSGWTAAAPRHSIKDERMQPSSFSRAEYPPMGSEERARYEYVATRHAPDRWTTYQHQSSNNAKNYPLQTNAPTQRPIPPGGTRDVERDHIDELEVTNKALHTILAEVNKKGQDSSNVGSGSKNSDKARNDLDSAHDRMMSLEITLQKPVISEQCKSKLFHIFWSGILLHWPLFTRRGYESEDAARTMIEIEHPFLFNTICSIAAILYDEEEKKEGKDQSTGGNPASISNLQMSTIFYARARYYDMSAFQSPCLQTAGAYILLSLRASGTGHSGEAAQYCWNACRMVLDLGLHRYGEMKQSMDQPFQEIEDEQRRRIYWCAYVLDKTLASQLGRPPILRSCESDCPLPFITSEDEESTRWEKIRYPKEFKGALHGKPIGTTSYFINGCRLSVICEAIIEKVRTGIGSFAAAAAAANTSAPEVDTNRFSLFYLWQYNIIYSKQDNWQREQGNKVSALHYKLTQWMKDTPEHLRWIPNKEGSHLPYVLLQQIWGQVCMILIHRPYILKGSGDVNLNSHAECSKATEKIFAMFQDHERQSVFHFLPSGAVYLIFTAATISLANTTSMEREVADVAKAQLEQFIRWLTILSKPYKSATQHIAILHRLTLGIDNPTIGDYNTQQGATATEGAVNSSSLATYPSSLYHNGMQQLKSESDSTWHSTNAARQAFSSSNNAHANAASSRYDVGANELQSIDAFWNDMPLGENFQRWDQFTQAYFKTPLNSSSNNINNNSNHNMA